MRHQDGSDSECDAANAWCSVPSLWLTQMYDSNIMRVTIHSSEDIVRIALSARSVRS